MPHTHFFALPRYVCTPRRVFAYLVVAATSLAGFGVYAELTPQRLRCEYRNTPLGVDRPHPELSWIVTSDERSQVQTAYQILVASSREKAIAGEGDLWDTGKTKSSDTYGLAYSGRPLESHQECYWKVRSWDGADRPGPWSDVGVWTVGLLSPNEWQGEWIGYDAGRETNADPPAIPLDGAHWVRPVVEVGVKPPKGEYEVLGVWDLPPDADLRKATLAVISDDNSSVKINGVEAVSGVHLGAAKVEQVVAYLHPGRNEFRVVCRNNSPGPTGVCIKVVAETHSGETYVFTTDDSWLCTVAPKGSFAALHHIKKPVEVVGPFGCAPWGRPQYRRDLSAPPAYLRADFSVDGDVRRATVYLAALGWADLTINGQRVGDDYFTSGWTDYRHRVYYRAYDATDLVCSGENAWGVVLADGWYSGHIAWGMQRDHYGRSPRVSAMLRVELKNGETRTYATNTSWKASTSGPKRLADGLVGEEYDATREISGWDMSRFADWHKWATVDTGAEVSPRIEWHPGPPVVEVAEFPAVSKHQVAPNIHVYDLGQNFAGVVKLKVNGRRGQQVRLRFAERLNTDGTLYTDNLRMARATDIYTCRGDGVQVWQPTQTFHGFQYVEVAGVEAPPLDAVVGVALSSDTPLASGFTCSNEDLNRLYANVLWTQRANFIDIPTDCPQRDERLGWTGDAQVYVRTASLVTDTQAFFRKWLVDLIDAQRDDGQFPKVAPVIAGQDDGGPAWSDAGVVCPWEVYLAYGDKSLLERQYPSMVRFVEFCRARSRDETLPPASFHCFGDWLNVNDNTPNEVIYTAYYARSTDLLSRAARVLGKAEDAEKYEALFDRIKCAFVDEFVSDDGRVRGNTQCGYVLAIYFDLLDDELRAKASDRLISHIGSRGYKLATGFVGTKDLMLALTAIGRHDIALRLLHQRDYPGWLYSISHGATSIWERWDGWTPERGFQDPGMNSFAHYSFGAVYGWMVENLGGIRAAEPGYKRLIIEPTFDPELTFCRVAYDSIRGPIICEWKNVSTTRQLTITIPANAVATVRLRGIEINDVAVDGRPAKEFQLGAASSSRLTGVSFDRGQENPAATLELPSGEYQITMPLKLKKASAHTPSIP